jgi:type II secretory pathway pseudopilin PulG
LHFFVALGRAKRHILVKTAQIENLHMPIAIHRADRRRASPAGFTLLELMAMIAIAGVLMALMLPALSTAKEKSRRSVCADNIRNVVYALTMYGGDYNEFLPSATDNRGDYHSIVLSSVTYSNLVDDYLYGESNILYCPNLVQSTGTMGGYNPQTGYTIGYSYLAAADLPATAKGPDETWTGPVRTTEAGEVFADANYWSKTSSQALTVAPHTASSSVALMSTLTSPSITPVSATPTPGSSSTAMGAVGGNIGSLDDSVIWRPIRLMNQYSASLDGTANGNW